MLVRLYATLLAISTLIVFARLSVRAFMIRAVGVDDYVTVIAFVSNVLTSKNC